MIHFQFNLIKAKIHKMRRQSVHTITYQTKSKNPADMFMVISLFNYCQKKKNNNKNYWYTEMKKFINLIKPDLNLWTFFRIYITLKYILLDINQSQLKGHNSCLIKEINLVSNLLSHIWAEEKDTIQDPIIGEATHMAMHTLVINNARTWNQLHAIIAHNLCTQPLPIHVLI